MIWKSGLDLLGLDYVWGGNSVKTGLDCSGLVCLLLRENGIIKNKDYSSQMLFDKLRTEFIKPSEDAILFFGKDFQEITHVAIAIDKTYMIESSGEGRTPTNEGKVRIKRIKSRSDFLCAMKINIED